MIKNRIRFSVWLVSGYLHVFITLVCESDSDSRKWYKYVHITTNQPDTKSNLLLNPNLQPYLSRAVL